MQGKWLVFASLLAGCAQSPESIRPAYVSPMVYLNWSCPQIFEEQARLTNALATASIQQEQARSNDTAAVIFLGLTLASMTGANIAPEIARYKGEQEAVRLAGIHHSCSQNDF